MKKESSRLLHHLKKNLLRYLTGILTLLCVDYLDMFIPQYIGETIDGLNTFTLDEAGILRIVIKLILCAAGISLARAGWRYFIIGSAHRVINGVRKDIFEKLETLSQRYFNRNKTGDIMTFFTNDLEAVEDSISFCVISSFDAVVLTCMCLYRMMTSVSIRLTLFTMIPMAVVALYGLFIFRMFDRQFFEKQEVFGKLNDAVQEAVSAERVIKAFVQEKLQCQAFERVNDENRKVNIRISLLRAIAWPVMEALVGIAYMVAIILGGYYTIIGDITPGEFVMFSSYIGSLVWPMLAIGDCITTFSQGLASMRRIHKVFDEQPEITDEKADKTVTSLNGGVSFDHVSFRYEENLADAVSEITIDIKPGETFAIMGRTGSGKTTMASLMTRLYDVTGGTLRIDGMDIRSIPLHALHENIAYVPQDNFLFSDTLNDNLKFGKLEADQEEIQNACRMADVHDNIMELTDNYNTLIGERGVTLSGGQKQRVSIARALLKNAPILIMDDSLSAVDTDTEDTILKNLKELRQGKTTIMIAHRISTVQNADHILVLEEGRIAEKGTYGELIEKNGIFADMVRKQQLEKQLENEEE